MKQFLSSLPSLHKTLAALAIVFVVTAIGGSIVPHTVHAQGLPPSSYGLDPVQQGQATAALVNGTTQAVADGTQKTLDWGDSLLKGIGNLPDTIFGTALSGISYLGFQISTFLLGIAGVAFNYAIVFFVFHFATTFGNSPGMLVAWGVVRDFCNIIFLFGFIFMGVITILDLPHYGAKDVLPKFIIAAVLINFSLFGVSAIIDGANVLAAAMYNQAMGAQGTCIGGTFQGLGGTNTVSGISSDACKEQTALNVGLAGKIIEVSRVSTVLTGGSLGDQLSNAVTEGTSVVRDEGGSIVGKTRKATVMFGLALFVFAAAIVLAAGTALLVGRAITLALLMVGSPILVIGMVISPLKKQADEYWKMLINNAIFAPVFLLLVFVSLKVAEGVGNKLTPSGTANGANLYDALTKGDVTYFGSILTFVIIIGFLFASLIAAKQFSIRFADKVNPLAGTAFLGGAGKVFGLASDVSGGWLIRQGARIGAQNMRKSGRSDTRFGMGLTQTLEGVAGSKAGKGLVTSFFGAPLMGALGAPKGGGGGGAGGGGGHGGSEKTPEQAFLEKSASQRKARLGAYDTQIKAYQEEEKEVDLEIENAQARGDEKAVLKGQEKKAALRKKIEALKVEKRETAFTPAQKEKYDRLVREGGEKAAEYQATIERSRSEKGALDANVGELDAQIAELETRLANPDHQGEERIRDQQALMDLHSQAEKVRQQVLDKSKEIANLQAQLIEHENKSTAELAAFEKESVDAYKTAPLRTYTRDVVADLESAYTLPTLVRTLGLSALRLGEKDTLAAISKLRAEELKPADQRAWEHWMHELHEKIHAEVEKEHAAGGGDHHAPAPAAAPAQPAAGGGDHGGGHH